MATRFHGYYDSKVRSDTTTGVPLPVTVVDRTLSYAFHLHNHPYVDALISAVERGSLDALFAADIENQTESDGSTTPLTDDSGAKVLRADGTTELRPKLYGELFSQNPFDPSAKPYTSSPMVEHPYPVQSLDFSADGAYASHNWELYYHIPRRIYLQFAEKHKFTEFLKWHKRIADLTSDSAGPAPERYWKLRYFQSTDVKSVEDILVNLSTNADPSLRDQTIKSIQQWTKDPFQPFAIARLRPSAFMLRVVRDLIEAYLANVDDLLMTGSPENIPPAIQCCAFLVNILGPRPQAVPKKGTVQTQTYASLRGKLNEFGDALVDLEADVPFDIAPLPTAAPADGAKLQALSSIGQTLYFCIPRNQSVLAYWDRLADRLFKIHNSLNLEGVFQQLPLFDHPLDPALLARAAASGLDVAAIVSGLNQPLPLIRFAPMLQQTLEHATEVETIVAIKQSAMERRDEEMLSLARARNESTILRMALGIKYAQWQEAKKSTEAVKASIDSTTERFNYYNLLTGSNLALPAIVDLDENSLFAADDTFQSTEAPAGTNKDVPPTVTATPTVEALTGGTASDILLSASESLELSLLDDAATGHFNAGVVEGSAGAVALIPQFGLEAQPFGVGGTTGFGGEQLSRLAGAFASAMRSDADKVTHQANMASKMAAYQRRRQDWLQQLAAIGGEFNERYKQYRAAQIREASLKREYDNSKTQIDISEQIEAWISGDGTFDTPAGEAIAKTTGPDFYSLRLRRATASLTRSFQFLFERAKRLERECQLELGDPSLSFIGQNYQPGTDGLMGVKDLIFDLRRMQTAYADLNRREYELVKHVSLLQLDPAALMQLRATGQCNLSVPEELFDMDCPGQHFRRIRSVGVTIPCVVGPYTSVNCRLTLQKSSIRTVASVGELGYPRTGPDDSRFNDYYGTVESIVTSTAQNDGGVFDASGRDERKLPFEFSGAVCELQLELLSAVPQFDRMPIRDVLLHFRFTSREAGEAHRSAATANLESQIAAGQAPGSVRLLSLREDFPDDWQKFKSVAQTQAAPRVPFTITLQQEHYPPWSTGRLGAVLRMDVLAQSAKPELHLFDAADSSGNQDTLLKDDTLGGLLAGTLAKIPLPAPTGAFTLFLDDNTVDDVFILLRWGAKQGS